MQAIGMPGTKAEKLTMQEENEIRMGQVSKLHTIGGPHKFHNTGESRDVSCGKLGTQSLTYS
jgi:hypothetical protein